MSLNAESIPTNDEPIQPLEESKRWRARTVTYWAGTWKQLSTLVPRFELADFRAEGGDVSNPYMKSVVREPRAIFEKPMPVGVVSNTYTLAQHHVVAEQCFNGIQQTGIAPASLRCEVGLTELGEWMNLRVYFPEQFDFVRANDDRLGLRLECYNSVDGSSRLVILLGWLRFVCTNGLVIGETKTELRDIHNQHLDISRIPELVREGMAKVQNDLNQMRRWEESAIDGRHLVPWVNKDLVAAWGKKAACRVYHICSSGFDVEISDPFASGEPTEKLCVRTVRVPGSPEFARDLFDVSQAMSWVATARNNAEERLEWQASVPELVGKLAKIARRN